MFAEITIAILLILIIVGFTIYFYIQIKKTKDSINDVKNVEEENIKLINSIKSTYPDKNQLDATNVSLSNAIITQQKKYELLKKENIENVESQFIDLETKFKEFVDNKNEIYNQYSSNFDTKQLTVDGFTFMNQGNSLSILSEVPGQTISLNDIQTSSLNTSNLQIGSFNFSASNGEMMINSGNNNSKINFASDVHMTNVFANTMNISGKMNFASVDSPTTFDLSPEGDLRLIMSRGSNGMSPFRSFDIVDDAGKIVHKFDVSGTATHVGDVNITGSCINFGSNHGNICYDTGRGINILGGQCNIVTVSDNMNAGSLTTNTLGIGNLSITSSNGNLVVVDTKTNNSLGTIAYMQQI